MRNEAQLIELRKKVQALADEVNAAIQVKQANWNGFEYLAQHSIATGFGLITSGLHQFVMDARSNKGEDEIFEPSLPAFTKMHCVRCGHDWVPRGLRRDIRICPDCKSPYWNTPRKEWGKRTVDNKSQ